MRPIEDIRREVRESAANTPLTEEQIRLLKKVYDQLIAWELEERAKRHDDQGPNSDLAESER